MYPSLRRCALRAGIPSADAQLGPTAALARGMRAAVVTLLCGLTLLVGAAPAFAHTRLESSNPADGTSLAAAPQQVSLTFSEPMQAGFNTLTVIGPNGQPYQAGDVAVNGDTVSVGVAPLGPAGRYEIGYRVVSQDGHPVTGSVAFQLTTPGPAAAAPPAPAPTATPAAAAATAADTAAPAAASTADTGSPVWPWIAGGVILIGIGAFAALRLGRS